MKFVGGSAEETTKRARHEAQIESGVAVAFFLLFFPARALSWNKKKKKNKQMACLKAVQHEQHSPAQRSRKLRQIRVDTHLTHSFNLPNPLCPSLLSKEKCGSAAHSTQTSRDERKLFDTVLD